MPSQIFLKDADYPAALKEIFQPPETLWTEGDISVLKESNCVALVGSRQCTEYGKKVAFDLARDLSRVGWVVISGLAYGIDTAAHEGALEGGGKTIAVLGCGIDLPYPAGNRELRKKIALQGLMVSEFPIGMKATPWTFPKRNRIISGLSRGVVVVEAGLKSGSLITANFALQQGRDVFAVPGSIHSEASRGTHHLIQNGAKLVMGVEDILEEWQLSRPKQEKIPFHTVEGEAGAVLKFLSEGRTHMDELSEASGLTVDRLSFLLVELEISGKIKTLPGGRYGIS